MINGSHNSFTSYPLLGWQKYFSWIISPFVKCQDKGVLSQLRSGIRLFDIQVADLPFKISHGIVYHNTGTARDILNALNNENDIIYIMLGLDNHFGQSKKIREEQRGKFELIVANFDICYPHLKLVRAYIEKPWQVIYEDKEITSCMFEKYWSLSWARSMKMHWWQFYYYLPCPRLWKWIYGKKWDKEARDSGKEYYVTDFV